MWNREPLKFLNDTKFVNESRDPCLFKIKYTTFQNLQRFPISQTSNWSSTFFKARYSKCTLVPHLCNLVTSAMFCQIRLQNVPKSIRQNFVNPIKGGLISESFSPWLHLLKNVLNPELTLTGPMTDVLTHRSWTGGEGLIKKNNRMSLWIKLNILPSNSKFYLLFHNTTTNSIIGN